MKPPFPEWISVKGEMHWSRLSTGKFYFPSKNPHDFLDLYYKGSIDGFKQSLRTCASCFRSLEQGSALDYTKKVLSNSWQRLLRKSNFPPVSCMLRKLQ